MVRSTLIAISLRKCAPEACHPSSLSSRLTMSPNIVAATALAMPAPGPQLNPDPAQTGRKGNGAGEQFIGGECVSSADCGSRCCAFLRDIGICSGPAASFQQGKNGCGFGDGVGGSPTTLPSSPPAPTENPGTPGGGDEVAGCQAGDGLQNCGKADGSQFITGVCLSRDDCASDCCQPSADGSKGTCAAKGATVRGCDFLFSASLRTF